MKEKYINFLETSYKRNYGVIAYIVVNAIKDHIEFYNGDNDNVDWEDVEESLEAYTSGWLSYTQDLMDFYSKNWIEVNGIINQDEPQSINASGIIKAIYAACYQAYDTVLSDIVNQLRQLEE